MFELVFRSELHALHSLHEREEFHAHRWIIKVCIASRKLSEGRIVSLPLAKEILDGVLGPLANQELNGNRLLDSETAKEPTCENLSRFVYGAIEKRLRPTIPNDASIRWVEVAVVETDGRELGCARYFEPSTPASAL